MDSTSDHAPLFRQKLSEHFGPEISEANFIRLLTENVSPEEVAACEAALDASLLKLVAELADTLSLDRRCVILLLGRRACQLGFWMSAHGLGSSRERAVQALSERQLQVWNEWLDEYL